MRLFWLGLMWLAGIAAGRAASLVVWQWLILAAISILAILLFRRFPYHRNLFVSTTLIALGAAWLVASLPTFDPTHVAYYNDLGCRVSLNGVIVDTPDVRDNYVGLTLSAERLYCKDTGPPLEAQGTVLVRASRYEEHQYGDRVRVYGILETPPVFEDFSYRDYLARQGIHSLMPYASVTGLAVRQGNPILQAIHDFRIKNLDVIYALFPDPEASLLAGILLGIESGIPGEVREAFNETGTTHIIAISGFNITIIAALFISLFGRWLGARRGAIAAVLAIVIYTVLVGADAAVVRAAIMGGLALLARRLGRQTHGLASLSAAAILMTAFNPLVLWDVGFQLSFAATLGLILYAEPLKNWFIRWATRWLDEERAERIANPVSEFVLFTLAAQITTMPLMAYYFRRISLVSLLANPVILPVQPPVMILGGLAMLVGALWLPLARPLAWIAWPFPAFTIRVVEFFARWPSASIPLGRVSLLVVAAFYTLLFGITVMVTMREHMRPYFERARARMPAIRLPAGFGITTLFILTALVMRVAVDQPDGRLHLSVLDVGAGDAVLIRSPTGGFVLVDGGPSPLALSDALGRRLSPLERKLDWIVVGGTEEEQIGGLAGTIERYRVGNVLLAGQPRRGAYRRLMDEVAEAGTPVMHAVAGQWFDLGGGARLEVVTVGKQGAILLLTYGNARILLMPGADPDSVDELMRNGRVGEVQVLILGDGGYEAVNPPEWLKALTPWLALISVEAGNPRGLPSPAVRKALERTTVLRTDLNGWIELTTDGERLWVEVERQ